MRGRDRCRTRKNGQPLRLTTVQRLARALKGQAAQLMASRPRQTELPDVPGGTQAELRSDLMEPAPTEHELHQLAARAAALEEVAILYGAVHAQRAAYPTNPRPTAR
jgi:hypothetical protein